MRGKLHTDALEKKYGPVRAIVLRHDDVRARKKNQKRFREVGIVDKKGILRTYALTLITYDRWTDEIAVVDDEIRRGGLIGKTFEKHGYIVQRRFIDAFAISIPRWMKDAFQVDSNEATARLVEFNAEKERNFVQYGIILEIDSPDFRAYTDEANRYPRAERPDHASLRSLRREVLQYLKDTTNL